MNEFSPDWSLETVFVVSYVCLISFINQLDRVNKSSH